MVQNGRKTRKERVLLPPHTAAAKKRGTCCTFPHFLLQLCWRKNGPVAVPNVFLLALSKQKEDKSRSISSGMKEMVDKQEVLISSLPRHPSTWCFHIGPVPFPPSKLKVYRKWTLTPLSLLKGTFNCTSTGSKQLTYSEPDGRIYLNGLCYLWNPKSTFFIWSGHIIAMQQGRNPELLESKIIFVFTRARISSKVICCLASARIWRGIKT